ncbi:hypothetical protein ASG16_016920 [Brevibacillus sp. Leaf182]|nr:hypothetical protein ASG16_016920 [Brevibacillus sp. Leaf182]
MKKQFIFTKLLLIGMLVCATTVSAHSSSNSNAGSHYHFIPNAKPTDWQDAKIMPLPDPDEWKTHVRLLKTD